MNIDYNQIHNRIEKSHNKIVKGQWHRDTNSSKNYLPVLKQGLQEMQCVGYGTILSLTSPLRYKKFMIVNSLPPQMETLAKIFLVGGAALGLYAIDPFILFIFLVVATILSAAILAVLTDNGSPLGELAINKARFMRSWKLKKETKQFINHYSALPELYNEWKHSNGDRKIAIEEMWNNVVWDEWSIFMSRQKSFGSVENKLKIQHKQELARQVLEIRKIKNKELPILNEIEGKNR